MVATAGLPAPVIPCHARAARSAGRPGSWSPGGAGLHDPGPWLPVQLPADLARRVRLRVDVEVVVLRVLSDVLRERVGYVHATERLAVHGRVQRNHDRAVRALGTLVDVGNRDVDQV